MIARAAFFAIGYVLGAAAVGYAITTRNVAAAQASSGYETGTVDF